MATGTVDETATALCMLLPRSHSPHNVRRYLV